MSCGVTSQIWMQSCQVTLDISVGLQQISRVILKGMECNTNYLIHIFLNGKINVHNFYQPSPLAIRFLSFIQLVMWVIYYLAMNSYWISSSDGIIQNGQWNLTWSCETWRVNIYYMPSMMYISSFLCHDSIVWSCYVIVGPVYCHLSPCGHVYNVDYIIGYNLS